MQPMENRNATAVCSCDRYPDGTVVEVLTHVLVAESPLKGTEHDELRSQVVAPEALPSKLDDLSP